MDAMATKVVKSDEDWRKELTPEQYAVTRKAGTERAFTGPYVDNHETGAYDCVCCGTELFSSDTKFDSGSGWPSFTEPANRANVKLTADWSYGMHRIEGTCAACDGHLGHVFSDGPGSTGGRYCLNFCSL